VDGRFDVVLTTGSGYPLDQNVYQSVKGMSAAYQVVRPGGTIVCAAECRDGFPEHGSYRHELTSGSPQQLLAEMAGRERTVPDQWQVQIQARIQSTSRVVMHTSYLSDAELAAAHPGADRRHHRHRRAGAALGGPRRPAVRAARGTPVGFQKSTCVCDLQRSAAMHDRRRVSTAALPDLQPTPELGDTAPPRLVVQGHRTARPPP
jgi:hypothetical protein